MDLDLQKDAADIYKYVWTRANDYQADQDRGPGGTGLVHMVYAGYEFDQAGWLALIFDRRPDAGHDGLWTNFLEGNMLERVAWPKAREKNERGPIRVRGEDGQLRQIPKGTAFGPLIGNMLVGVLQRVEREGNFAHLSANDEVRMGLEEFNGSLGWDSKTGYGGSPG